MAWGAENAPHFHLSFCHRSCEIYRHSRVVNRVGKVHFNACVESELFRAVPRGLAKNRGDFSLRFLLVYACDTSMHFIRVLFCCISTAPLDVPLFLTGFRDHQIEVPAYNLRLQMPTKMKDHLPAKEFL